MTKTDILSNSKTNVFLRNSFTKEKRKRKGKEYPRKKEKEKERKNIRNKIVDGER